jgi:hypothetical protein
LVDRLALKHAFVSGRFRGLRKWLRRVPNWLLSLTKARATAGGRSIGFGIANLASISRHRAPAFTIPIAGLADRQQNAILHEHCSIVQYGIENANPDYLVSLWIAFLYHHSFVDDVICFSPVRIGIPDANFQL